MVENIFLREAREKHGWSRGEVVDKIKCGAASYHRWETQGVLPTPYYRRKLSALFGRSIEELGFLPSHGRQPSAILPKEADLDLAEIHQALNANLFLQLCSIMGEPVYECRCEKYALIMEEFEEMNMQNGLVAAMTRRQAVTALVLLPFTPPLSLAEEHVYTLSASKHDLFLQQVGAALVACEDLVDSPDPGERFLVFRCVSRYLAELKEIVKSSSQYQERAQELASRYAILKTNLGWGCAGDASTVLFAEDAVEITREFGHTGLHLSALSKLAWARLYQNQEDLALVTAEEARVVLERHKYPLPACISGGIYSTLSVCQAKNFLDPDFALKKAGEQRPGNQVLYGMKFDESRALLEQGIAQADYGQTSEAMAVYSLIIDRESLQVLPAFQGRVPEGRRLEALLRMAEASLTGRGRDMDEAIRYWQTALANARKLSKHLERKTRTVYREMLRMFPGEDRIEKLGEQLREKAQQ